MSRTANHPLKRLTNVRLSLRAQPNVPSVLVLMLSLRLGLVSFVLKDTQWHGAKRFQGSGKIGHVKQVHVPIPPALRDPDGNRSRTDEFGVTNIVLVYAALRWCEPWRHRGQSLSTARYGHTTVTEALTHPTTFGPHRCWEHSHCAARVFDRCRKLTSSSGPPPHEQTPSVFHRLQQVWTSFQVSSPFDLDESRDVSQTP